MLSSWEIPTEKSAHNIMIKIDLIEDIHKKVIDLTIICITTCA